MKYLIIIAILAATAQAATFEEAKDAYLNASLDIEQLKRAGIPAQHLEDTLEIMKEALEGQDEAQLLQRARLLSQTEEGKELAKKYLSLVEQAKPAKLKPGQNFTFVVEKASWIADRKTQAYDARDALKSFEAELSNTSEQLNLTQVDETMSKARESYNAEDFNKTQELIALAREQLEEALVKAARERAFLRLARRNIVTYSKEHWAQLLLLTAILAALSAWALLEGRAHYADRKLDNLRQQLKTTDELKTMTQKDYYTGKIGRETYFTRMDAHQEKIRTLKGLISIWEGLLKEYSKKSILGKLKKN